MSLPCSKEPNRREPPLGRWLRGRLRLTRATEDMYIVEANGQWVRRYKPPRSKKQRRILRKALAAAGLPNA